MEDNDADVFLIREAIEAMKLNLALHIVTDGEQAVRFFDQADADAAAPCPALVVLDINLPRRQGGDVLKHMRLSPRCGRALVVAVSTSESGRDRDQMMQLGANHYFRKPSDYADFMKLGEIVRDLLAAGAREPIT